MSEKTTIQIRITAKDKARISELAAKCDLSLSVYVCQAALNIGALDSERSLKKSLTTKLCEHADLCELVKNPVVYQKLKKWRREAWLSLR